MIVTLSLSCAIAAFLLLEDVPLPIGMQAFAATASGQSLTERLEELVPTKQAELKDLQQQYGSKSLGEVSVAQVRRKAAWRAPSREMYCSRFDYSLTHVLIVAYLNWNFCIDSIH